MNIETDSSVSVLGLGLMGSALAEALLNAGHKVTVWNRTPTKAKPLTTKGALSVSSVSDAISASDVTLICVTGHNATVELLNNIRAPADGKTLVQLSTMTPDESRELARWAETKGMRYLDGAIFGVPSNVVGGKATMIYSGPKELFDANETLFTALGAPKHLSSEIGASVTFDRVWYAFGFALSMAFMQGAAMAHAQGFSLDVYFDMVKARSPIMIEQCLKGGERIAARSYEDTDAPMEVWIHTFEGTLSMCRDLGVDDSLPSVVMNHFKRASASGYADSDLAAVFEVLIPTAKDGA
jgi:3-hydroxyisobutyrate dehydrogenase-like beta-hydroxyacid dehydrogenase